MKKLLLTNAIAAVTAVMASAGTTFTEGGLTYTTIIDASHVEVSAPAAGVTYSGAINIPETVTHNGVTYTVSRIGNNAFKSNSNITSLVMPNTVKTIGVSGIAYCSKITSITLSNSLDSILNSGIPGLTSVSSITLPNTLKFVGNYAIGGGFLELYIPASLVSCNYTSFSDMTKLQKLVVDPANPRLSSQDNVLYNKEKTQLYKVAATIPTLNIPSTVTNIYSISNCTQLKSLIIPNSVTYIAGTACRYNTKVDTLHITENPAYTTIGAETFLMRSNTLTTLVVPDNITKLDDRCFSDSYGLTTLVLSKNLTSISGSFTGCKKIATVKLMAAVPPTVASGKEPFATEAYDNATLYVPEGSVATYKAHATWGKFKNIQGVSEATYYDGKLDILMMGNELANGQAAQISITPLTASTCRFELPNFKLESLGLELGNIVIPEMSFTVDGDKTNYTGTVKAMKLAGGAITADVTVKGYIDKNGDIDLKIDVVWDNDGTPIPIDVWFYAGTVKPDHSTTGIESLTYGQGQATYYDLMGRKVQNPQNGIYVKVQGGHATKVAL